MVKRILCLAVLFIPIFSILAQARILLSIIGPTTATSRVLIAAAGSGVRNCLTDIDVISDAAYTLRILNGGTTVYALVLAADSGFIRSWDETQGFCGSANTLMEIYVSAGTNYNINYKGFTGS